MGANCSSGSAGLRQARWMWRMASDHDRSRPVIAASTSLRWCRMLVFASLRIQARMHEVPPGSNKPNKPNKPRRPAHAPGNTTTSPWSQAGGLDREIGSLGMVVHLHWSRNPKLVRETTLGITVCGVKAPHEQLTAHLADTTCHACLEKARQAQEQC